MFARHLSGGELTEYADGEMAGTRRRRAQQHLSRCERCAGALAATWEVVEEVRACHEPEAPYDLRMRIASRVSAETLSPISCRAAREFIQQDLDGELSLVSAGLLRLHLEECPACAGEQRTLRATTHLVRSLPPVLAPAGIWEKAVAGHRARPALSWGARLRPVVAAAAMAAGAILLGLHSLPQPAGQRLTQPEARSIAPRPVAVAPVAPALEPAVAEPVAPEPTMVAQAEVRAPQPAPVTRTPAPRRPSGAVRQAAVRNVEQPPITRVIAITAARPETESKVETAAAPRKSRGLQALAMMAKAVPSENEGRVSLARQSEPWEVFGDEAISEVPLTAVVPITAPGPDSPGIPASQPNTGARDPRPGVAEVMRRAA